MTYDQIDMINIILDVMTNSIINTLNLDIDIVFILLYLNITSMF